MTRSIDPHRLPLGFALFIVLAALAGHAAEAISPAFSLTVQFAMMPIAARLSELIKRRWPSVY